MHNAPFVFGRPVEGDAFTDRVAETARLKANFAYGINLSSSSYFMNTCTGYSIPAA